MMMMMMMIIIIIDLQSKTILRIVTPTSSSSTLDRNLFVANHIVIGKNSIVA